MNEVDIDNKIIKKVASYYCENLKRIIKVPLNSNLHAEGLIAIDTENNIHTYPKTFRNVQI